MTRIDYNKLPLTDGIDSSSVGLTQKSQQEIFEAAKKYYMEKQQGKITHKKSKDEILDNCHKFEVLRKGTASIDFTDFPKTYRAQALAAMDEWAKISGIPWLSIAEGYLPPVSTDPYNKSAGLSDVVLIYGEPGGSPAIGSGYYVFDAKMWSHNSGNWQPTHWAVLNYPEK